MALPNLILAWYFSSVGPAAAQGVTLEGPGELELDDDLLKKFEADLAGRGIHLKFYAGAWSSLHIESHADLVLTSETVYALPALPSLCHTLHSLCWPTQPDDRDAGLSDKSTLALVAAKVLYFGVGGGVEAFQREMSVQGGWCRQVRSFTSGVGRVILQVGWSP